MKILERILNKWALMPTKELEEAAYKGLKAYVRDVNMPESFEEKYFKGQLLREPDVTEASGRIGGMVTDHRFVILSNHMEKSTAPEDEALGVFIALPGARFKVLGRCSHEGKTAIVLLHLPDAQEHWSKFWGATFPHDKKLMASAAAHFREKEVPAEPVEALCSADWIARCSMPIGMDEFGKNHPLEDKKPAQTPAEEAAPAGETAPAEEAVPAEDTTPAEEAVSAEEVSAAEESAPVAEAAEPAAEAERN